MLGLGSHGGELALASRNRGFRNGRHAPLGGPRHVERVQLPLPAVHFGLYIGPASHRSAARAAIGKRSGRRGLPGRFRFLFSFG